MNKTLLEVPSFVLNWSEWIPWNNFLLDQRTERSAVNVPNRPGVYEVKLENEDTFLTIGKASDLRMRVKQGLVKGKVPHSSGERIRKNEDVSRIFIRWAETERPSCAEEELHRGYISQFGKYPKYTKHT